ncbi:MAG TPA: hypothetical protein VEM38_07915 [Burkholderiales bacterium]|nr:hypothetical protein [Burkholderiales bacterium]
MRHFIKRRDPAEDARGTGRLNLLLTGFGRQDVVPVDDIVRAVDLLPAFHLEGLREIAYLPEYAPLAAAFSPPLLSCSKPKGEFVQRERRIFVYGFDEPAMLFHMLHHEIGHFVFYFVIGSRVKKHWVTEIFPGSGCVSRYAAVNAQEDFAESYAYYVRRPQLLEREHPEKFAFMRDCVFSGRPDTLKERADTQRG